MPPQQAHPLKIGLFGIGLDAYWRQFPGLEDRLRGYVQQVAAKLERPGVEVVNLGLVDTAERAFAAAMNFDVPMSTSFFSMSRPTHSLLQSCLWCDSQESLSSFST